MTVIVDEALWWWRGRRWAHLASDSSLAELHEFAGRLGLRRVSFGGDHYDVTEPQRRSAIARGAEPIGSRDLVRRLRRAGLRRPAGSPSHRWDHITDVRWPAPPGAPPSLAALTGWSPHPEVLRVLAAVGSRWAAGGGCDLRVLRRPGELALLLSPDADLAGIDDGGFVLPAPPLPVTGWWLRTDGEDRVSLEILVRTVDEPTAVNVNAGAAPVPGGAGPAAVPAGAGPAAVPGGAGPAAVPADAGSAAVPGQGERPAGPGGEGRRAGRTRLS